PREEEHAAEDRGDRDGARDRAREALGVLEPERPDDLEQTGDDENEPGHGTDLPRPVVPARYGSPSSGVAVTERSLAWRAHRGDASAGARSAWRRRRAARARTGSSSARRRRRRAFRPPTAGRRAGSCGAARRARRDRRRARTAEAGPR